MQDFLQNTTALGWMGDLFPNAAGAGMPYLNQAGSMLPGYYQPFINAGLAQLPNLQQQYGQLTNNPGQFINKMGQNFQQSPGFQFQTNQALNAANRASAAGGMVGTPMEQQNIATTVNGLANQDYYNWMNHAMGAYGMGLQGEQGLYNTGYGASNDLASNLAAILQSQAQLAYAGQANENDLWGGLIGAGIGAMSGRVPTGGGAAMGGMM